MENKVISIIMETASKVIDCLESIMEIRWCEFK